MPYFSISSKYRGVTGDPSVDKWAESLPLGSIWGKVSSAAQSIATGAGFKTIQYTTTIEDTANFFPVLSVGTPLSGITIPREAGGMYLYRLFGAWGTFTPTNFTFQITVKSFLTSAAAVVDASASYINDLDGYVTGFVYLNPNDILTTQVTHVSAGANALSCTFKLARVTV